VRPDLREPPLGRLAEPVVHRARDRELEDAVPEELEPLVRSGPVARPGRVGVDLLETLRRELGDQRAELLGPSCWGRLLSPFRAR
jgi:hypothetical protein